MAVTLLRKKTYMASIRNAAKGENHLFRNTFAHLEDIESDITKDGHLSSGKLVSSILYLNKLIHDMHVTVEGTEKDMRENDWQETNNLKAGEVLIWEPVRGQEGNLRTHIGFYLGDEEAMSNNGTTGFPEIHHYTFNGTRNILKMFVHPVLDGE
jgi:hypothetical protein